ncbi:MAG: stage II sporulation protein M, partial [Nitrosopumilus sp.]|nr:stage II sporulation protein M [Nitrosopumilus sp.]NNL53391.1 stage II sporulation protein M [Nitrosopumilus sp.]
GLFSAWSTGFAFASLATLMPALGDIPSLALLYISPFGLMELVAYSLGISRSYILIHTIIKKLNLTSMIKPTAIEIGILVGLLLGGAILEDYMIRMAQESGMDLGF